MAKKEDITADSGNAKVYKIIENLDSEGKYNHSDLGKFSAAAIPWKFGATPLQNGGTAPSLGQHTRDILTEVLDLSDTEINELVSSGIVTMQKEVR